MPLTAERVGDQAAALRLFQKLFCPLHIGASRDMQFGVSIEAREAHLAFDAVAMALKLRTKQSATDAVNNPSGDH